MDCLDFQVITQVSGYQIDSRFICPGDLFFALKGVKTDGHHHLSEVAVRGGRAALVSEDYQGESHGLTLFRVPDVLSTLQALAKWSYRKQPTPIIGITGSVGKTTTKEFLATLLEEKFHIGKSPLSYNSQITFPLNILNRSGQEELLILEYGMSVPGEIARLVKIAPPRIGILTEIGLAHAQSFPEGLSAIAREKGMLFSSAQCVILHREFFSFYPDLPNKISPEECSLKIPFQQSHLIKNALLAITAARYLGLSWEEIHQRLPHLHTPKRRFELFEKGGIQFINDAYNANPSSMRAALQNLPPPKQGGKTVAVLASMKELGTFSHSAHHEIGLFAQKYLDHLLVIGEEALPLHTAFAQSQKPAEFFHDHRTLAERLSQLTHPGDVVLVKGSLSMQLEKIFDALASL